jgi:hypothetical protein
MQLSSLLGEENAKTISQRTNISEENIGYLLNSDFGAIKRVKTLGFISILEREYKVDLDKLREEALAFYGETPEMGSVTLSLPIMEEKRGNSKLLWLLALLLLGYASWYFFTRFDRAQLQSILPFNEETSLGSILSEEVNGSSEILSIKSVIGIEKNESAETK